MTNRTEVEAFYWRAGMTHDGHQWVRQDEADAEIRRLRGLLARVPQDEDHDELNESSPTGSEMGGRDLLASGDNIGGP